eukprot:Gb_10758 [translate_table: standard]
MGPRSKAQYLDTAPLGTLSLGILLIVAFLALNRYGRAQGRNPPGTFGWPLIGETLEFFGAQRSGKPAEFFDSRIDKYGEIFRTSIVGHQPQCFAALPETASCSRTRRSSSSTRGPAPSENSSERLLSPQPEMRPRGRVDSITRRHLVDEWNGKDEVKVFPLMKHYTFSLACNLFASVDDEDGKAKLSHHFMVLLKGVLQIPIDFPGTRYNKAKHSASAIRRELQRIIDHRRIALANGSHDTSSATLTLLIKYLAEQPHCYEGILKEQLEIAGSKPAGQFMEWEDLQKMKYSWRVVQESLRMMPPVQGTFRKAMTEFTYGGFTIPEGWRIYWTVNSMHRKAKYFENPEKFDPSRFEGAGPAPYTFVPFGGGPRMCPGNEFARMEILVFFHNIVKIFKWNLVDPEEKVTVDPMPAPVHGLPIKLQSHLDDFQI